MLLAKRRKTFDEIVTSMSEMAMVEAENTMAFGGVATGNMKA
jgi:hypothetical protein